MLEFMKSNMRATVFCESEVGKRIIAVRHQARVCYSKSLPIKSALLILNLPFTGNWMDNFDYNIEMMWYVIALFGIKYQIGILKHTNGQDSLKELIMVALREEQK